MPTTASSPETTGLLPSQQKMVELLRAQLSKAGVDFNELDALQRQASIEFQEINKRKSAEVLRKSAALSAVFERDLEALRSRLGSLVFLDPPPASTTVYLLDTAATITSTEFGLTSSNAAKANNSAEFDYTTSGVKQAKVTFSYNWNNPTGKAVVLNVTGFISFNGVLSGASGGGSFAWGHHHAHARIATHLTLTPPDGGLNGTDEFVYEMDIESGGFGFDVGAVKQETVFRGLAPALYLVTVPTGGSLQVAVVGALNSDSYDGSVQYNFAGNGRRVVSAGVLLTVLS